MSLKQWKPSSKRTFEDNLLLKYWRKVGGVIYAEVMVGGRRLDGLRLPLKNKREIISASNGTDDIEKAIASGRTVEVIEIKDCLDRLVIGQSIVGADLMEMEWGAKKIRQVILCETGAPLLERVCKKRGIRVFKLGH